MSKKVWTVVAEKQDATMITFAAIAGDAIDKSYRPEHINDADYVRNAVLSSKRKIMAMYHKDTGVVDCTDDGVRGELGKRVGSLLATRACLEHGFTMSAYRA